MHFLINVSYVSEDISRRSIFSGSTVQKNPKPMLQGGSSQSECVLKKDFNLGVFQAGLGDL